MQPYAFAATGLVIQSEKTFALEPPWLVGSARQSSTPAQDIEKAW
ncbi:hypothetical protein [Mesorhizobium sp. B2-3-4]|nr:hypothetical protein [Mesorhizobium sp. B2-3-4]